MLATTMRSTTNPPTPQEHVLWGLARSTRLAAVMAWGKRPEPFRTRKLSPTAPMVLHLGGCGRVGHHRNTTKHEGPPHHQVRGPHAIHHPTHNARHHTPAAGVVRAIMYRSREQRKSVCGPQGAQREVPPADAAEWMRLPGRGACRATGPRTHAGGRARSSCRASVCETGRSRCVHHLRDTRQPLSRPRTGTGPDSTRNSQEPAPEGTSAWRRQAGPATRPVHPSHRWDFHRG